MSSLGELLDKVVQLQPDAVVYLQIIPPVKRRAVPRQ